MRTPYPKTLRGKRLCASGLPGAEPVNVEIENGGDMREGVEWWDRDSASPELHVAFTHPQPFRCLGRADAGPFERPVEACGEGAPEAVVLRATLEVTDILGMSIHPT